MVYSYLAVWGRYLGRKFDLFNVYGNRKNLFNISLKGEGDLNIFWILVNISFFWGVGVGGFEIVELTFILIRGRLKCLLFFYF